MTVNDKLQNFRDINLEDARARLKEQLDACGAELDAAFEKHKEEREKAIREKLREEETVLRKELNRTFSQKQAEMRQQVSAKEKSIREELFAEATNHVGEYATDGALGERGVVVGHVLHELVVGQLGVCLCGAISLGAAGLCANVGLLCAGLRAHNANTVIDHISRPSP